MNNSDHAENVKAREFQIYKEACGLAVDYNPNLRAIDLRTMGNLLSYMNHLSYTCFPSVSTVKAPLHAHKRTIERSLDRLDSEGHFRRERRWNRKKRKWDNSIYQPLIPDTVMPAIETRFCNQPDTLAIINKIRDRLKRQHNLPLGTGKYSPVPTGEEMPSDSLNEPPSEPLSVYTTPSASRSEDNSDSTIGKEKRLSEGLQAPKAELARSPDPPLNRGD